MQLVLFGEGYLPVVLDYLNDFETHFNRRLIHADCIFISIQSTADKSSKTIYKKVLVDTMIFEEEAH